MKITWTNQNTQYELAVRWWNAKENSLGSRIATLADLKRANEEAGLLSGYRDEVADMEQKIKKLKVRLAVLEAEQAAYLDALAVDGLRPTSVLVGIESLKAVAAGLREEVADADAIASRANATAEKLKADFAGATNWVTTLAKSGEVVIESREVLAFERDRMRDDLTAARERIAELEGELCLANGVNRRAAQSIIECIGSVGPEDADSAAERIVSRLLELERANACARETINAVDKVLTLEARHPPSLDIVGRVRGLAEQANGLAKIIETRGNTITELEAALAEAKGHFALANEAYDELQARHVRRAENVMRKSHFDRGPFDASTLQAGAYVRGAAWGIDQIADGAHVGAAKKGGG